MRGRREKNATIEEKVEDESDDATWCGVVALPCGGEWLSIGAVSFTGSS